MGSDKAPLFGPKGIRGIANNGTLTVELALKVGQAAGILFRQGEHRQRVLIGKDTRLSGYMLECALVAGFTAAGMDVLLTGPIPTSAVAMLTRSMRADLGVMISASHASFEENGIRLFGPDGSRLSPQREQAIAQRVESEMQKDLAGSGAIGRATRVEGVGGRYVEYVKRTLAEETQFEGIRAVVDCANGAAYRVAPQVFEELGVEVAPLGVHPNGININRECGTTAPHVFSNLVRHLRADVGVAFDGDGDHLLICDKKGALVQEDQLYKHFANKPWWCDDALIVALHVLEHVYRHDKSLGTLRQHLDSSPT